MPDDFTPIDPTLLKTGALAALQPFFGDAHATPTPKPTTGAPTLRLVSFSGSLSVAGSLAVSDIFKIGGNYDDRVFIQDTSYGWPALAINPPADAPILGTFWGSSLRVSVRVSGLDVTAGTSLFAIAAAVQLQRARAQYEICGLGVGLELLADALSSLPAIGSLDFTAFAQIDRFSKLLANTFNTAPGQLIPLPIAVKLRSGLPPSDVITDAKSIRQAMIGLANGMTLSARLASLRAGCLPQVVNDTYKANKVTDPGAPVPADVRAAAAAWVQGA